MAGDLVIFGVGPFAKLMHFYFTHDSEYKVRAFTVDAEHLNEKSFFGLPVIPFEAVTEECGPAEYAMFVAVGYRSMRSRRFVHHKVAAAGYRLVNYISSKAFVYSNLIIGSNNVVMAGAILEPFVTVGDNNVFWSGTQLCHESTVGNHNYFAPRCVISGNCTVGNLCFFGTGAIAVDGLRIQDETFVAAGATLVNDTERLHKYAGCPAKSYARFDDGRGIVID